MCNKCVTTGVLLGVYQICVSNNTCINSYVYQIICVITGVLHGVII